MMRTGYELNEGALILARRIAPDPPVRADGRCAECGHPRKVVTKPPHLSIDAAVYSSDPFCSSRCARAWHKAPAVDVPGGDPNERRGRYERKAA